MLKGTPSGPLVIFGSILDDGLIWLKAGGHLR